MIRVTHDEEIIQEATEIYEKNQNAGALVGDLLRIIKSQKAEIEKKDTEIDILIRKKHALRDEISELTAEIERLSDRNHKCIYLSDDETTEFCVDGACPEFETKAMIKTKAYRKFVMRALRKIGFVEHTNATVRGHINKTYEELMEESK